MANLVDTSVNGDLRVTGKIYGTVNAVNVNDANLAVPAVGTGDYVGSTGDYFVGSGSGRNLPDSTNNFNIHATVTHYTSTTYRVSQIATPTSSTQPTGIYERCGTSTTGTSWTFGSWMGTSRSSHSHGNITSGGTLQTTDITIANGDKLVVTDSSNSSKVARTSVSFDGSTTTTALTPKGTFEAFAKAGDITSAIQALDVSSVGGDGKYISAISETDGKISATATTMDTTPTASSTKVVTSGGIKTALDGKVDVANIDLTNVTTTILSQVQQMAGAGIHYRRFFTVSDGGAANISDKPVSGAGFMLEAYCNRRLDGADWRYVLLCYVQGNEPYFATVSNQDSSITWRRLISDRLVKPSSDTSSWSGDNTNVPTRGAVQGKLDGKVDVANIDLTGQTTTILSKVQQMAGAGIHYRRFFTTSNGGAANIPDKPVSGAGFLVEIYCDRRVASNDWRYVLFGYSQDHKPYFASVANGDTSLSWVQLLSSDRVKTSRDTSSWSSDNSGLPTRAAVEAKISDAMSGSIGGFIGVKAASYVYTYQQSTDFKKGDWISIGTSGTVTYYPNNNRSGSTTSFSANAGDEIYWTTSGTFETRSSTSVQVLPITELTDWNTLTSTGLYQIASQASGVQNSPASGATGISCLVNASDNKVTQMTQTNATIFYRTRVSGVWSSWRDVKDADNYVYDGVSTSIGVQFADVFNAIYNVSNGWIIRVVQNLPSNPEANGIYLV